MNPSFASLALLCIGCSTSGTKLYGPKSCEPDEHTLAAYPTANGTAAICITRSRVEFMLCTRELGLSNVLVDRSASTKLSVAVPDIGEAKGEVDLRTKEKQEAYWSNEGELAKARADMIRACVNMLPTDTRPVSPTPHPQTAATKLPTE